jgi:O-antigen/teichoic acid export membrane protein
MSLLAAAAVISKAIGTLQKIPLQNLAGDRAFGIYNAVYPFYTLILVIATAGFPVAVSAFVSERAARGEYGEARRVLALAVGLLTFTGFACFALLFFGADLIAGWIGIPSSAPAIRSVSFALLIVPAMAALRGYFQGLGDMLPTAVSQVIEQLVRVATMVWLLLYFSAIGAGESRIAAGATFGSVTGAVAGLLVVLAFWRRSRAGRDNPPHRGGRRSKRRRGERRERRRGERLRGPAAIGKPLAGGKPPVGGAGEGAAADAAANARAASSRTAFVRNLARSFLAYALPVSLGSIALPMLAIVDSFTLPRLLAARSGGSEASAMHDFGLYNHGQPLVQLVAMIAASMAAALVPAIAEARERGRGETIRARAELAVRLTWLPALAASFGLAVLAVPMNVMFYKTADGSQAMAILAFTAAFSALNIVSAGILQGMGAVLAPAVHMVAALAVKAVGNAALVPAFGISGAAAAAVIAHAAAGVLNLMRVRRLTGASFALMANVVRPLFAALLMCAALLAFMWACRAAFGWPPDAPPPRLGGTAVALGGVAVGAAVYLAALIRFNVVTQEDLMQAPAVGRRLLPVLDRLRRARRKSGE